jgi:hypothetical protein
MALSSFNSNNSDILLGILKELECIEDNQPPRKYSINGMINFAASKCCSLFHTDNTEETN